MTGGREEACHIKNEHFTNAGHTTFALLSNYG